MAVQNSPSVRKYLVELSRPSKQIMMVAIDVFAYLTCAICAGWLLLGDNFEFLDIYYIAAMTIFVAIPLGWMLGLYVTIVRFIGTEFLIRANLTALISAAAVAVLSYWLELQATPYRWAIILSALLLLYICFSRFL